jgi:phosphoribosyl 1,2-cyclic phosphate phosphodiesterase
MIKLTFLGTGTSQGVPMIACPCEVCHSADPRDKRLRTSALVEAGGRNIVIDAGPDFRMQMLSADVTRLDAILLTHEHKDHTGGIDDVRAYNYFGQTPIDIWATERVQGSVRRDYAYAFDPHPYPGAPEIALHTIGEGPFDVKGVRVMPIAGLHMTLPVTGFRIGGLAYLTDFNRIEDSELEKLRGVDTLVVNAVGHKRHISHFCLGEAIDLGRSVGARQTFITHMAHRMGRYEDVEPTLPAGVHLAYDGLKINL